MKLLSPYQGDTDQHELNDNSKIDKNLARAGTGLHIEFTQVEVFSNLTILIFQLLRQSAILTDL